MPLGVTPEERAKAERVVQESKKTAHVDTGRLKRSIDVRVQRGKLTFRQYFYGIYNDNSDLERNAKRMMGDTPYSIELLDEDGSVEKTINNYQSGRLSNQTAKSKDKAKKKKVNKANELIKRVLAKRKKDGEDNSNKDNRE